MLLVLIITSCGNDDDRVEIANTDKLIGTWKLVTKSHSESSEVLSV